MGVSSSLIEIYYTTEKNLVMIKCHNQYQKPLKTRKLYKSYIKPDLSPSQKLKSNNRNIQITFYHFTVNGIYEQADSIYGRTLFEPPAQNLIILFA